MTILFCRFRQSTGEGLDELWKLIDRLANTRGTRKNLRRSRAPDSAVSGPPDRPALEKPALEKAGPEKPGFQKPGPEKPGPEKPGPEKIERIDLATLKDMSVGALTKIAKHLDVPGATGMRKQELIFEFLARAEKSGLIFSEGVLETLPDGFGFLRAPEYNYLPGPDDIYVSVADSQIRSADGRYGLGPDPAAEGRRALLRTHQGRGDQFEPPERAREKVFFDNLTPLYPQQQIDDGDRGRQISARVIDMCCRSARVSVH